MQRAAAPRSRPGSAGDEADTAARAACWASLFCRRLPQPAREGCGTGPREGPHPRVALRSYPVLIPFRSPALTLRTSGELGVLLHRSPCPSAVPVNSCASRNAFGAGLTLGAFRREPPASCRRLCAAAEGARGRGRRAQGRSRGQERGQERGQVRREPGRARRCCGPVGTRLPSASPYAARAAAAGWRRERPAPGLT